MTDSFDSSSEAQSWLVVFTTDNPAEAHIVAGRLEDSGFHPWVQQEPGGSAIGITVGILGAIRVLVPESEFQAAQHLLRDTGNVLDDDDMMDDEDFDFDDDDLE